jgi:two-component system sensor histidine kinase KdpD
MFFNLFERGNKESPITGIGLGLSISKAIIHAHGGSINIKNHKEGGASVTFSLPLGTPPAFNLD